MASIYLTGFGGPQIPNHKKTNHKQNSMPEIPNSKPKQPMMINHENTKFGKPEIFFFRIFVLS
jgi:hypothetical protein